MPLGEHDSEPQETNFTPDLGHLGGELSSPWSPIWNPFGKVPGLFSAPPPASSFLCCFLRERVAASAIVCTPSRCLVFLSEPGSLVFSEFRVWYSVSQCFQDGWGKQ